MSRKYLVVLVLTVFVNFTIGCTSTNVVSRERNELNTSDPSVLEALSSEKIVQIERDDGVTTTFNAGGAKYKQSYLEADSVIVGLKANGELSITKLKHVRTLHIEQSETNAVPTILGVALGAVLVFTIMVGVGLREGLENLSEKDASVP